METSATERTTRRTPVEMDALRARMIREGYPLSDLTAKENERVWVSLTQKRRWPHLLRLTGFGETEVQARVREVRKTYQAQTGKR